MGRYLVKELDWKREVFSMNSHQLVGTEPLTEGEDGLRSLSSAFAVSFDLGCC